MNVFAKMNGHSNGTGKPCQPRLFSANNPPSLEDFKILTSQTTSSKQYPLASSIVSNVPVYNLPLFSSLTSSELSAFQDEWYHILLSGPGVFVTKNLYRDTSLLSKVNEVYASIITTEASGTGKKGDHFASSGSNSRIWNSFSKHCLASPSTFLEYYSNPYIPLISAAWLGPHHRLTAQVNIVRPGSAPQISHRDYHIGFQSADSCAHIPRAAQIASQFLTLQGAVAHSDMPLESGPTRLLPFSQMYEEGYMAYRIPEFQDYFADNFVAAPLEMGDGLFFNPALFHAAGRNDSVDIHRSANLLQVSSAFGKPMELIDTYPLIEKTWDALVEMYKREGLSEGVKAFVGNVGEGYPFPTNLDKRVPETAGMAPDSEQDLLIKGLEKGLSKAEMLELVRKTTEDARP
jgi:ectoine hydroxylase-related dioxygenase (phytanoyl-CoA dioxygenase family)